MTIAASRPREPALPDACRVTSAVHGSIPAFHIYGEVDYRAAAHVRTVLAAAVGETSMLVDLSGVVFVDHAGLEAVVAAIYRAQDSGACVAIAVTSPAILRLLRARGLRPAIHVMATAIEALGWLDACRHGGHPEPDRGRTVRTTH